MAAFVGLSVQNFIMHLGTFSAVQKFLAGCLIKLVVSGDSCWIVRIGRHPTDWELLQVLVAFEQSPDFTSVAGPTPNTALNWSLSHEFP